MTTVMTEAYASSQTILDHLVTRFTRGDNDLPKTQDKRVLLWSMLMRLSRELGKPIPGSLWHYQRTLTPAALQLKKGGRK